MGDTRLHVCESIVGVFMCVRRQSMPPRLCAQQLAGGYPWPRLHSVELNSLALQNFHRAG